MGHFRAPRGTGQEGLEFEMPGKSEIMRAVRDGLDNLEIDNPEIGAAWGKAVKTKLCTIGRKFGCKVCARDVDKADRDYGEWLYDVTWLDYERECDGLKWPAPVLIEAPLVAECEWGNEGAIKDDFEKLLLACADIRLMIFDARDQPHSEEIARGLARMVREFNSSRAEDAWLLASWEGSNDDWSFRYFTIGHCQVNWLPRVQATPLSIQTWLH